MTVRFTVRTEHPWSPRGWIWVVVHDNGDDMKRAAESYRNDMDHSETSACFQGRPYYVKVDDSQHVIDPEPRYYAGVLRMTAEHGVATLSHECVHAALAIYGRQRAIRIEVGQNIDDEEPLCYIVGDLVGQIVAKLYEHGVWSRAGAA